MTKTKRNYKKNNQLSHDETTQKLIEKENAILELSKSIIKEMENEFNQELSEEAVIEIEDNLRYLSKLSPDEKLLELKRIIDDDIQYKPETYEEMPPELLSTVPYNARSKTFWRLYAEVELVKWDTDFLYVELPYEMNTELPSMQELKIFGNELRLIIKQQFYEKVMIRFYHKSEKNNLTEDLWVDGE